MDVSRRRVLQGVGAVAAGTLFYDETRKKQSLREMECRERTDAVTLQANEAVFFKYTDVPEGYRDIPRFLGRTNEGMRTRVIYGEGYEDEPVRVGEFPASRAAVPEWISLDPKPRDDPRPRLHTDGSDLWSGGDLVEPYGVIPVPREGANLPLAKVDVHFDAEACILFRGETNELAARYFDGKDGRLYPVSWTDT